MTPAVGAASPEGARWLDDAPGVAVAHAADGDTGVTVIVTAGAAGGAGAIGAVDVRGGGPGTRETDLLEPHNTVERVHAVCLCGGSAFGLAAADGAMRELADRGHGFEAIHGTGLRVPLVPAAVIFDLACGNPDLPDAAVGRAAVADALDDAGGWASGSVGAGTAALAGALKGGVGRAGVTDVAGHQVAAVIVANPVGAVADPATGRLWADPDRGRLGDDALADLNSRFVGLTKQPVGEPGQRLNTTIGAVITDAPVTPGQARRLAMAAHDGLARTIRPSHLPMDGDTVFALGLNEESGGVDPSVLALLSAAAAEAAAAAVVDAVVSATARGGVAAWADLVGDR